MKLSQFHEREGGGKTTPLPVNPAKLCDFLMGRKKNLHVTGDKIQTEIAVIFRTKRKEHESAVIRFGKGREGI